MRRVLVGAAVVLTGVLVLVSAPAWHTTVDDAWITVRYAEHLAAGFGPVYNAGEWVEGSSNPLWTVLLALAVAAHAPMFQVLEALGLVHALLLVPAVLWLARSLAGQERPALLLAPLLVAVSPHVGVVATNGLETAQWLLALVVVLGVWATAATPRARLVAGLLCGGLAFVRPEALVIAPFLVACDGLGRRSERHTTSRWAFAAGAGLVLGAIVALRWSLYGQLVPNSVIAKASLTVAQLYEKNSNYIGYDGPLWPLVTVGVVLAPLVPPWRWSRFVVALVALATLAAAVRVEMWMPGARLLLGAWVLGAVGWAAMAAAGPERWRLGLAAAPVVGCLVLWVSGHPWRMVYAYDAHHSVAPDDPVFAAAALVAREVPAGSTVAVRDAGVAGAAFGTAIRVVETHPRALTRPHPDGANTDVKVLRDAPPELVVTTVRTPDMIHPMYAPDREVLAMARYHWLGRAKQHHRRYYDFWAREDLNVPPLPAELCTPMPSAPRDR